MLDQSHNKEFTKERCNLDYKFYGLFMIFMLMAWNTYLNSRDVEFNRDKFSWDQEPRGHCENYAKHVDFDNAGEKEGFISRNTVNIWIDHRLLLSYKDMLASMTIAAADELNCGQINGCRTECAVTSKKTDVCCFGDLGEAGDYAKQSKVCIVATDVGDWRQLSYRFNSERLNYTAFVDMETPENGTQLKIAEVERPLRHIIYQLETWLQGAAVYFDCSPRGRTVPLPWM